MSEADRAQELEAKDWEINNRPRPQRPVFTPRDRGYGPAQCIECTDEMPELRRSMGCDMCTDCTSALERKQKMGIAA